MCIAFDGAYILEAPAVDLRSADNERPSPAIVPVPAGAASERAAAAPSAG